MHLVRAKTRFNPYYIFSEIQKSYTKVCLNISLYYSEKLIHQIYSIQLLIKVNCIDI